MSRTLRDPSTRAAAHSTLSRTHSTARPPHTAPPRPPRPAPPPQGSSSPYSMVVRGVARVRTLSVVAAVVGWSVSQPLCRCGLWALRPTVPSTLEYCHCSTSIIYCTVTLNSTVGALPLFMSSASWAHWNGMHQYSKNMMQNAALKNDAIDDCVVTHQFVWNCTVLLQELAGRDCYSSCYVSRQIRMVLERNGLSERSRPRRSISFAFSLESVNVFAQTELLP
jgi:hypothetical protein